MISNKILPAHILALYTWEVLKLNTSLEKIGNLVPIIPLEDEPKFSDSGKTYLIYGYAENENPGNHEIKRGVFSLRVVGKTFGEVGQITNVLSRAFEDEDATAENVNIWSTENDVLHGIRFTSICTSYLDGGDAADSEGGNEEAIISISYSYVTHLKVNLPVSSGLWS